MEKAAVIKGITRQAVHFGLPMPYFLAVMFLTMLPFIILKFPPWLVSGPLWWLLARVTTAVNPNFHKLVLVKLQYLRLRPGRLGKRGQYVR